PVYPVHPVNILRRDEIGRTVGDALWPARFNVQHLENTKEKIGSYSFASLFQQHPVPAEGGLFKREWFRHIVDRAPHGLIWKRGYDLGITANPTSDYTASFRVAYDKEGNLYIDGGFRKRIEYPDQRRYVLGRIREELDTEHGIEDTANGSAVVQELRKEVRLQGRAFRAIKAKGDKVSRSLAWMNLAEAGNLRLVRAAWNNEFIDEACAFPLGTHDDQIDAVSIAVAMHAKHKYGAYGF
ncbi:MAG: phage terminase large subunit, partial [Pyrinomonadaceae bacterium]|nr:phage terminase large subunit [Pyrinomonadaceae bacterium]